MLHVNYLTESIGYSLMNFNLNMTTIILLFTIIMSLLFNCSLCQTSTSSSPISTTPAPESPTTTKDTSNKKDGPDFTVIYIVLIIVFAVLVLLVLLCIFYQYHRRGKLDDDYDDSTKTKGKTDSKDNNTKNKKSNSDTNKKNDRENSRSKSKSKSKSKSDKKNKNKNKNKKRNNDSDDVAIDTGGMYETDESGEEIPNQIRFRNSVSSVPDNGNVNAKMQLSVTTPRGTTVSADQYSDYQVKRDTLEDNMMDDVNEEPDDQDDQEPGV